MSVLGQGMVYCGCREVTDVETRQLVSFYGFLSRMLVISLLLLVVGRISNSVFNTPSMINYALSFLLHYASKQQQKMIIQIC